MDPLSSHFPYALADIRIRPLPQEHHCAATDVQD